MKRAIWLLAVLCVVLAGCGHIQKMNNTALPGRVVAISTFKCKCDPIVTESIQDSFVDVFFKYTNAKPVKAETGDIVIVGIISMDEGVSENSEGRLGGGGGKNGFTVGGHSSSTSAAGNFATGITAQAYKNGELIATYSLGQSLGQKGGLASPVKLASDAAYYLAKDLVRKNEINWN